MKNLMLLVLISASLIGCSSTEVYESTRSTNTSSYQYEICPSEDDEISDSAFLAALKTSIVSNSKFGAVRRVDGTSDVHIYKGLNLNIQNGLFRAAYLHRHSTEMDHTKNVNIDSFFEASANYQIVQKNGCSVFKFVSPFSYNKQTRRTIILTEVEQLGTSEELEGDLMLSLQNSLPKIAIRKILSHSATQNTENLAPRDIATALQVKHKIDAVKKEDKYMSMTSLKLNDRLTAELSIQILPFKSGSILQYSARVPYDNDYLGDGSNKILSKAELETLRSIIDNFIKDLTES